MRYALCQLVQLPLSPHENNKAIIVRYVLSVHSIIKRLRCDLTRLFVHSSTHVQITADMKQQLADLVRVSPSLLIK
jgi:hypothetical protein